MIQYPNLARAFLGSASRINLPPVAVYDYDEVVRCYMDDGMSEDEAIEFVEFNTVGAWIGEETPILLRRMTIEQFNEESQ